MIRFPQAKINLGLYITGKRTDGYHNIESVFYPIPLHDALEAVPADHRDCHLEITGLTVKGSTKDNLIYKAWKLMHENYGIGGVDAALLKKIPMGAGLGGGSSDGAHMLLLLNDLFDLNLATGRLEELAAQLGSDCPFFIQGKPALVTGRGENIEHLNLYLSHTWLAVLHPGVHISTKEAYAMVSPCRADATLRQLKDIPLSAWNDVATNHFEKVVSRHYPEVNAARNILENAGALYCSMSGSGSAVFALYDKAPAIETLPANWQLYTCKLS